jgi:hypothetical protein
MQFMIIERFYNRDPVPIYRRLRDKGRQMPDGVHYVSSWIEVNFDRCFQVMECDDQALLQRWMAQWSDLMDFEVVPVRTSAETRATVEPLL